MIGVFVLVHENEVWLMRHSLRAALIGTVFGAFLGCIAYLVAPDTLSFSGWVLFMMAFVVLGGIPGWYRKQP